MIFALFSRKGQAQHGIASFTSWIPACAGMTFWVLGKVNASPRRKPLTPAKARIRARQRRVGAGPCAGPRSGGHGHISRRTSCGIDLLSGMRNAFRPGFWPSPEWRRRVHGCSEKVGAMAACRPCVRPAKAPVGAGFKLARCTLCQWWFASWPPQKRCGPKGAQRPAVRT